MDGFATFGCGTDVYAVQVRIQSGVGYAYAGRAKLTKLDELIN